MKFSWSKYKYRILLFLSVFGPATITAISDNDAAGVATYSLAGAKFGYSILFILLFVTVLLAITQEMGVRIAVVSGKGLADIIRERYGIVTSLIVFICLALANMGTIVANFAALKATSELFRIPTIPLLLLVIFFAYLFIAKGNYKTNQRIFLFGTILYFSYIFSAIKSNPNWGDAVRSLFIPQEFPLSRDYIMGAIAVLGTTITPWGQFFILSYLVDKKISIDKLKYVQFESFFGAFLTDFFSFFMIVATAATLFTNNISLVSGEQAALAIRPFAGELAGFLFGFGLLNAAIMGIIIISLSTAYAFAEFFGVVGSLDAPYERGRLFYGIFIFQLVVGFIIVLFPFISLFQIVFFTQSINGILLPIIIYFLLKIANEKEIMGVYTNSKFYNYFAILGSTLIVIASIFVVISSII